MIRIAYLAIAFVACQPPTPLEAEQSIAQSLNSEVGKRGVRHAALRVDAPALDLEFALAIGEARDGQEMTPETPFLSASVGKLFTAAAVLSLSEQGALSLDDPITEWVDEEVLAGLPLAEGASLDEIEVGMLLSHHSGFPDLFSEQGEDGAPSILERMLEEPNRSWSRAEMLDYTREHGAAVGLPGEAFHYADVNYDLLGLVLEAVEGAPWHEVVRAQVIAPIGLEQTWYYNLEDGPDALDPIAGVWVGDVNLVDAPCMSADQAGGGLATTTADLVAFSRALEAGNPVQRALFEHYTEDAIQRGLDYGYGMWALRPKRLTYGTANLPEMVGVSGVTGSFVYYVPASDAVISGTFDQTDMSARAIRFLVADVLSELDALDR